MPPGERGDREQRWHGGYEARATATLTALSARLQHRSRAPKSPHARRCSRSRCRRRRRVRAPCATRWSIFLNFLLTVVSRRRRRRRRLGLFAKLQFDQAGPLRQPRAPSPSTHGDSLGTIAESLQDGVISNQMAVPHGGRMATSNQGKLKAGEYLIPAQASMREIMDTMVDGRGHPLFDHHSRGADQPADRRPAEGR